MEEPDVLVMSLQELRESHPHRSMVLEIHEAAVTSSTAMRDLKKALSDLDIQLAYDDFGEGQARLGELVDVPPDYLKFDLKFVRGIEHASPDQRNMLQALVHMARSMGVAPLAEGVETPEADQACRELGFTFGQGFHYGRPATASRYLKQQQGTANPTE
jgi:EAL domain-containing protein (putative c-di-GMP-specific phosphodiesterase class I)